MRKSHTESCKALIFLDGEILLILRDNKKSIEHPNYWDLPGGRKNDIESNEEAIRRELREEISYIPEKLKFLISFETRDGINVNVYYSFLKIEEASKFQLGNEGQKLKFFNLQQLNDIRLTPVLRSYIEKNYESIKQAVSKRSFTSFKHIL